MLFFSLGRTVKFYLKWGKTGVNIYEMALYFLLINKKTNRMNSFATVNFLITEFS